MKAGEDDCSEISEQLCQKSSFTENGIGGHILEDPILVLRFKRWVIYYSMAAILICCWLFSFGTILPYLTTGDFNQIWPANVGREGKKAVMYIISWIFWAYSPTLISFFAWGDIYFFRKHIEMRPLLPFINKRIVKLEDLHVKIRKGRSMLLTGKFLPKWWKSPYIYWKLVYLQGVAIPKSGMGLNTPEKLPEATELVKNYAKSITYF